MCEMATFGMPLITSDIDICREISNIFGNVMMISNDAFVDLSQFRNQIDELSKMPKNSYLFEKNTVGKEVQIIKGIE